MPAFDLPLDALRAHRSSVPEPHGFDAFWRTTIVSSRALGFEPTADRVETGLVLVDAFDVTFSGYDGEPVRGWLHRPAGGSDAAKPAVVRYVGYNCGRALPHMVPPLALAGYSVLTMDNRGQGAVAGYASDTSDTGGLRRVLGGHVTRGIEAKESYYYRRLYTDAVLAVDAARALAGGTDGAVVTGVSQGGGIALAAAGLAESVTAALIDVPFLSDVPRALDLVSTVPYGEISTVLATYPADTARALEVLSWFDGVHLARRATAPAIFSVGLMDDVCPPSTVYAAFNAYGGSKEIREYPYAGHEGGGFFHEAVQLEWLARQQGADPARRERSASDAGI